MSKRASREIPRMYLAESRRNIAWHALGVIIAPEKYAKHHPEYFPLVKGKRLTNPSKQRVDWQPCVSNKEVQRLCAEYILKFNGQDGADGPSLSVNDGSGRNCECESCRAMDDPIEAAKGNFSNRYFSFYAKVMELARQKNPAAKAQILLYKGCTSQVPTKVKIDPGLIGMATRDVNLEKFIQHGLKQSGVWDHQLDMRYPTVRHYPKYLANDLRKLRKLGVTEYFSELYTIGAANSPKQYILGRLLWNPDEDPDAIMLEYCSKAYGPVAAPAVKAYYDIWETIHDREIASGRDDNNEPTFRYGIEKFSALLDNDTQTMAKHLKQAANAPMTERQRQRLAIVNNYFEYLRCLADSYIFARQLRQKSDLTVKEIDLTIRKCNELDKKFQQLYEKYVVNDMVGWYRYYSAKNRPDLIFGVYRSAVNDYVAESAEIALKNLEHRQCANMKHSERLAFWQKAQKQYPNLLALGSRLSEATGKKPVNMLKNGNFKEYTQGNPPKLTHWIFGEELNENLTNEQKCFWKIVPSRGTANHLGIGSGRYPELRQYVKLSSGIYRLSLMCRAVNPMSFKLVYVPNFHSNALNDIKLLRQQKLQNPAVFNYIFYPKPGLHFISQMFAVKKAGWYGLLIASPNQPLRSWNRIYDLKLERYYSNADN